MRKRGQKADEKIARPESILWIFPTTKTFFAKDFRSGTSSPEQQYAGGFMHPELGGSAEASLSQIDGISGE